MSKKVIVDKEGLITYHKYVKEEYMAEGGQAVNDMYAYRNELMANEQIRKDNEEARKINDPDPLEAIFIAKRAGADQITLHLREDRRHMNDDDISRIVESSFLPINIESSINSQIIDFLLKIAPHRITLVPENRQEVTTEGGLNVEKNLKIIQEITKKFHMSFEPKQRNRNGIRFHTLLGVSQSYLRDSTLVILGR